MTLKDPLHAQGQTLRASPWYWWVPLLAIALLVSIVGSFIWIGLKTEREERHAALVSDSLWMEQNLRFHLESTENTLSQIGAQLSKDENALPEELEDKIRALLQGSSGIVAILWSNADGATVSTIPASSAPVMLAGDHDIAILRARALNRPTYSHPFVQADGAYAMEVIIPIFGGKDFIGHVIGVYSLQRLIEKHLPWWFAERYRFALTDGAHQEFAVSSSVSARPGPPEFQVSLDQIGGMGINVSSKPSTTRVMPALVAAILLGFALLIAWSMWALRNHVLRLQTAESALRREHAFRLAMENSALVGLCARDVSGRITHVNTAFCRMIGWPVEELVGCAPPMPYWIPGLPYIDVPAPGYFAAEAQAARETRFQRRNGEIIDVLVYEAPLVDADGKQSGWMGSILDITERKRAEALARSQQERLEVTARLVSMGEMASTLAHEINQPLAALTSYSAGCLNALRNGRYNEQQFLDVLEKINQQAQRAGRIVHRIYDFVKRSESRREAVEVNLMIREALGVLESDVQRRKIKLECALADALPIIQADRTLVEQVIINLLRNGMDAMQETPEAGRVLQIRSEWFEELGSVRISVTDRGAGVSGEIADRLFDSFFTTKPEGMGMGLKICRSVAEQHNGRLWFESVPEGGTTFYLQLPLGADLESIG